MWDLSRGYLPQLSLGNPKPAVRIGATLEETSILMVIFPVGSIASVQRGTSGKHARAGIEELSEETYLDLLKYVTNDSTLIGPLSFKETICTAPEA